MRARCGDYSDVINGGPGWRMPTGAAQPQEAYANKRSLASGFEPHSISNHHLKITLSATENTMSEDVDFLRAMMVSPSDDSIRLAYTNWLEQHDSTRAEFFRRYSEIERV